MTGPDDFEQFLHTDPADVGCEQALQILHVYAELVLADIDAAEAESTPAGTAARRYPGVAAHLLACGPCAEDLRGLLIAARN